MSDIEKVKQLREATGAGFKDCNLAIKESGGDLDKAVEILRVKGISKASKKMSRDAKEGVIATSGDENKISVIEINCETIYWKTGHSHIKRKVNLEKALAGFEKSGHFFFNLWFLYHQHLVFLQIWMEQLFLHFQ